MNGDDQRVVHLATQADSARAEFHKAAHANASMALTLMTADRDKYARRAQISAIAFWIIFATAAVGWLVAVLSGGICS